MYLMCDFGYKPLNLVAGTKRYNKTIKALGDAQEKFTGKTKRIKNSVLYNEIDIAKIDRGQYPMELRRDIEDFNKKKFADRIPMEYVDQLDGKNRFDNSKPSDLDTTKSRRFLPFKPKPDSPLNEMSPVAKRFDIGVDALGKSLKLQKPAFKAQSAYRAKTGLAMDGLAQKLRDPNLTAKKREKAYRTYDRISKKKPTPISDM